MNVISVLCPPNPQLHLARYERGLGTSSFTLCLERWKDREPARQDSQFCPVCIERWKLYERRWEVSGNQPQESTTDLDKES